MARTRFIADPITDFGIIGLSLGFGLVLDALIGTGELTPQQPNTSAKLISIDRNSVSRTPSKGWNTVSNVGLYSAAGFAVIAPLISAYRFGGEAGWVDAIMFAETVSLTTSATNLAKIAVRRPRPLAYQRQAALEAQYGAGSPEAAVTGTDTALSFFSGHASTVASIGATATYLSFARSPGTPWPWITLGASTAATVLTSYGRVAAGKHFPTDVIAGSLAGAAIGLMVPHLHRAQTAKQRPVWLGGNFSDRSGEVTVQGLF
ncbi:MAG: phosphatase PAP2 family protein [Myxococcales bacterium]|nr:MAG: phosphatase PAP2 family protein [Myxococcales bacterium]